MTPPARRYAAAAVVLAGAAGVFWLPYAFPPQLPAYSESYTLGFSNRAAVLAAAVALGLMGLLASESPRLFAGRVSHESLAEGRVRAGWWLAAAAVYAAIDLTIYTCIPLEPFGESAYTLPRVAYFADLGLHPYRDFEFAYGPGLLYLPGLAQKGLGSVAPPALIYTAVHMLLNLLGLALLAWTLNALPLKFRTALFLALALAWAGPTMGLQYVTLRWVLPVALLIWVYRALPEPSEASAGRAKLSLRAALAVAAMLLVSAEYAVVLGVTLAAVFGALAWSRGRAYLGPLFAMAAAAGVFVLLAGPAYLQSIAGFASGGMLFPVYPTLAMLVYLAALALVVPPAVKSVLREGPGAAASLDTGWALFCTGLLPGALGRCDAGHVLMYGWAAMLAASAALARKGGMPARVGLVAWIAAFIVGSQVSLCWTYADELRPVWDANARIDQVRPYPPAFAARLDAYPALRTPFVVDLTTERYLQATGRFVPEYYRGLVDIFTPQDLARKMADLERGGELLVPAAQLALPAEMAAQHRAMDWAHYDRVREAFYRRLLLFPLTYRRAQEPFMPDLRLAQYVYEHYEAVEAVGEYVIMRPKAHSSSSPASSSSPSMPVEPPR